MSARANCAAVNQVVKTLQNGLEASTGIVVTEVIEGGSMGQGTAIPGKSDIDLVIYSRSILPDDLLLERKRKETLLKIQDFLQRALPDHFIADKLTPHAVQFTLSRGNTPIDVDLLPSAFWETPQELASYIFSSCPVEQRDSLSSGASKWQTIFIRSQPPRAKEYIKRAKRWRNAIVWDAKKGRPSSYLLSLLIVAAYRVVPEHLKNLRSEEFSGRSMQRQKKEIAVMVTAEMEQLVCSHRHIDIYWGDHLYGHEGRLPPPPRIIDPANPANNMYESGIGSQRKPDGLEENWRVLASHIHSLDLSIAF